MDLKPLLVKRKRLLYRFLVAGCLLGAAVALSIGYEIFQGRPILFWLLAAYIVILTGVAIVFVFRLIEMLLP